MALLFWPGMMHGQQQHSETTERRTKNHYRRVNSPPCGNLLPVLTALITDAVSSIFLLMRMPLLLLPGWIGSMLRSSVLV